MPEMSNVTDFMDRFIPFTEEYRQLMEKVGYHVVILETGRPDIAQAFYFITKASKKFGFAITCPHCGKVIDGQGNHQFVTGGGDGAGDLLLIEMSTGKRIYKEDLYNIGHDLWESKYKGKPRIDWDLPHYE